MVTEILSLSKLQTHNIFTYVLRENQPPDDHAVDVRARWFLFIGDLLQRIKFLTPEQQMLVLGKIAADFPAAGGDLNTKLRQLVFADGQYCTWDGCVGWLCLETGENTAHLPQPPLETIGYNLFELRRRCEQKIANRMGNNAEYHAGSMDKSGNVRDSAADALP